MRKQHYLIFFMLSLPMVIKAQSVYPYRDAQLKWGVINTDLEVLAQPAYDTILCYKNDHTIAKRAGKSVHLGTSGAALYSFEYDSLGYFDYNYKNSGYAGLAVAKKDGKYGLIAPSGQAAKEFQIIYEQIELETPGFLSDYIDPLVFIYKKGRKYGCKINGEQIGKAKYDKIYINFGDPKHLFFWKNKKGFYLNEQGEIESVKKKDFAAFAVGDPLYFIEHAFTVFEESGLQGLRNVKSGEIVIPPTYQGIQLLDQIGYILITPDQHYGLADHSGERLLEDVYKSMDLTPEGMLMVEEFSGRKGYWIGKLLLP